MPLVVWDDDNLTGDSTLDRQHQDLFTMVNELHDLISGGADKDTIAQALERLDRHVTTHIQAEERLMQAVDFPGYAEHKQRHEELGHRAAKVIDDYASGRTMLTIALARFFADWIRHHVQGDDQALIAYLRQHTAARA
jgi:hemerythrin